MIVISCHQLIVPRPSVGRMFLANLSGYHQLYTFTPTLTINILVLFRLLI